MKRNAFTEEQIQMFSEALTDFLNVGEVSVMLSNVLQNEIDCNAYNADLAALGPSDEMTDEQTNRVVEIECRLRNWLLLQYVKDNM